MSLLLPEVNTFRSSVYAGNLDDIAMPDGLETIFDARNMTKEQVEAGFSDISTIAIMGYNSQGPAHAKNFRDTFERLGVEGKEVVVALREPTSEESEIRYQHALDAGFAIYSPEDVVPEADFLAMLISDAGQVADADRYIGMLRPGSTLGFAHGFLKMIRKFRGQEGWRPDIDIIANCPKGVGDSVRDMYLKRSGIPASFAVEQDYTGKALEKALTWAGAVGAPFSFQTDLEREGVSDVSGERGILLGAVDAITKATYEYFLGGSDNPKDKEAAVIKAVETIVGPMTDIMREGGLRALVEAVDDIDELARVYNLAYPVVREINEELYENVRSGREFEEVIQNYGKPMAKIGEEPMWADNAELRASRREAGLMVQTIEPVVAGIYLAVMMAQVDTLRVKDPATNRKGHHWTEVVNESIIEAFLSLLPLMKKTDVVGMVDRCSNTAMQGDRKWRDIYHKRIRDDILGGVKDGKAPKTDHFKDFLNHDVHGALATLMGYQARDENGKVIPLVA